MAKIKLNNTTLLIIAFAVMLLFIIVMLIFNPRNPNQSNNNVATTSATVTDFNVPVNNKPPAEEVILVDPNLLTTASGNLATPSTSALTTLGQNPNQTTTGNPKMSTESEEQYFSVDQIENYQGDAPDPSVQELLAAQADIIGSEDFAEAGETTKIMLEDGLRSYFNLNPPPFLYRLIVIARTFNYDTGTDNGSFRLTVSSQQSNSGSNIHYNVTFTTNPPAINFTKL